MTDGPGSEESGERRIGPADTVETVAPLDPALRPVLDALTRIPDEALSLAEIDELRDELVRLSRGDFRPRDLPQTAVAFALRTATQPLVEKLRRGKVAALRVSALLAALSEQRADSPDDSLPTTALQHVVSSFEVAEVRLSELTPLGERLAEVAAQANVAALNVTVEHHRDGEASGETIALLAEEVRRLAERTDAATRRFPVVVEQLRAAQAAAREHLARVATMLDARVGRAGARELAALQREQSSLLSLFERELELPVDEVGSAQAERIDLLRQQLEDELRLVSSRWLEPPDEVRRALDEVESLLRRRSGDDEGPW